MKRMIIDRIYVCIVTTANC